MKLLGLVARLLGLIGILLCLAGIAGTYRAEGAAAGAVERGYTAANGMLAAVQDAVGEVLPRIGAARKHLAVQAAERIVPELAHLRSRLEDLGRTVEAATGVLEAMELDGVKLADLRARVGEVREAARDLTDRPEKRGPALERAEAHLRAVHEGLSDLRLGVADLRNRAETIIGRVSLALAGFFLWMGLGQTCLAAGRRRRDGPG